MGTAPSPRPTPFPPWPILAPGDPCLSGGRAGSGTGQWPPLSVLSTLLTVVALAQPPPDLCGCLVQVGLQLSVQTLSRECGAPGGPAGILGPPWARPRYVLRQCPQDFVLLSPLLPRGAPVLSSRGSRPGRVGGWAFCRAFGTCPPLLTQGHSPFPCSLHPGSIMTKQIQ